MGRTRRTRARAEAFNNGKEEDNQQRRSLRRRTTKLRLQELSDKDEDNEDNTNNENDDDVDDNDDNDDDEEDAYKNEPFRINEEEVDDKRYRRLKKTKKLTGDDLNMLDDKREESNSKFLDDIQQNDDCTDNIIEYN